MAGEGDSEAAFGAWLNVLCEEASCHLHIVVEPLSGGDPLVLVEEARSRRERERNRGRLRASALLIDTDRLDDGSPRSERAKNLARRSGLRLVRQRPRIEGVLLRLHAGHERAFLSGAETDARLRRVWPNYEKGRAIEQDLRRHFTRADLLRAAACDGELQALVDLLGL